MKIIYVCALEGNNVFHNQSFEGCITHLNDLILIREEIKKKYGASLSSGIEGISLLSASGKVLSTVPGGGGGSVDQSSVIRLMYGQDFSNDFNNDFNT